MFGSRVFEMPALMLVHEYPEVAAGRRNRPQASALNSLSALTSSTPSKAAISRLQVHPLHNYIGKHFGLTYTQDESYYMLDAGPDAELSILGCGRESTGRRWLPSCGPPRLAPAPSTQRNM